MNLKTLLLSATAALSFAPAAFAERGSDGQLNIIYWQAASTLNPYLSGGTKDIDAAALVLEPLGRFDENGNMVPYLAEEIPTVGNGGVAEDLTSITWKLKEGLLWSDGTPVTSADVQFTAQYCMDPNGGCAQGAKYEAVDNVEIVDERTVKVNFKQPNPNPYTAFMGAQAPIIQKAQFENCMGIEAASCAEENFGPIGTGPFRPTDFRPNDVVQYEANPHYRDPAKPAFANVVFKGGGSATEAGRAVMETGEFDYAWNMQLAPDVLADMEAKGKGSVISGFGGLVERIEMNLTDPNPELDAETRATTKAPHPFLSDVRVRKALSMALDRALLTEVGYGPAGKPTCDLVPAPANFAAGNTECLTQDIEGAKALLEEAGWTDTDGDGIRDKDGKKLAILYQTSTNAVRQDFQALIKQWWSEIGVETELRNIDASVFFGGDAGSPDTFQKFYADVEMYANVWDGTDPQAYMQQYLCDNAPRPETGWQGENINRFCNEAYDAMVKELASEGDFAKRGELVKKLNNLLTADSYTIVPLVNRGRVSAKSNALGGVVMNVWDTEMWNIADWTRQ